MEKKGAKIVGRTDSKTTSNGILQMGVFKNHLEKNSIDSLPRKRLVWQDVYTGVSTRVGPESF